MTRNVLRVALAIATLGIAGAALATGLELGVTRDNLAADAPGLFHPAPHFSRLDLVNAWGAVTTTDGRLWVADNGTGEATACTVTGAPLQPVISIPGAGGARAAPTGVVENYTTGFRVSLGPRSAPSALLFANEDGTVAGWSPMVDNAHAAVILDNSASGAHYTGITLYTSGRLALLYLANFHDGMVEVYDGHLALQFAFTDPHPPPPPRHGLVYTPFNVAILGDSLYVAFAAKASLDAADETHCDGCGFVDEFTTGGTFLRRVDALGALNAPWGLARGPDRFGHLAGALLVGNRGSGAINVYQAVSLAFQGRLTDPVGRPVVVDGLWGLAPGRTPDTAARLFFTSGPDSEAHGLVGALSAQ